MISSCQGHYAGTLYFWSKTLWFDGKFTIGFATKPEHLGAMTSLPDNIIASGTLHRAPPTSWKGPSHTFTSAQQDLATIL